MYLFAKVGESGFRLSFWVLLWVVCLYYLNENHAIRFSISYTIEVSSSSTKMENFAFLCQKKNHGCVYLRFFSFFSRGDTSDRKRSEEESFDRESEVLVPFLSDQKYWRAASPPHTLNFFPSHPIKILR